eukprot:IDg6943t1
MLAFLPQAGCAPATAHATSNTVAFLFIAQHPTFSAKLFLPLSLLLVLAATIAYCTSSIYVFPA